MGVIKCLPEDFDVQRLSIKYVYGLFRATTARRVRNDCKLHKADDIESTESMHGWDGVKIHQPSTQSIERED